MRVQLTALLLLTAALPAAHAFPIPPTFAARLGLETPGEVFTTGDFNKDGNQDIITVIPVPNSPTNDFELSVQLGDGKGGFTQGPIYDLGPNFAPTAIAAADVNGDGLLDVAVLSANSNALYIVLQRKGKNPVITPVQILDAFGAINIGIGDLNGDGRPDIVIPSNAGTAVLFNEGRGNFASPAFVSTAPESFVVLADVNNDKNLDLVLNGGYCCGTSVSILLGDGHGNFSVDGALIGLYGEATEIAVGDFNQDGKLDIAATSFQTLQIALGNGDGTFLPTESIFFPSQFYQGNAVATDDLNGDGVPDLAVVASGNTSIAMLTYLNLGQGVFGSPAIYNVQQNASNIQLAPLVTRAGAGSAGLALVSTTQGQVISVFVNSGNGVFPDGLLTGPSAPASSLVTGDFNNDGRPDIASIGSNGLTVSLNTGVAGSLFSTEVTLPFSSGFLVAGDFNQDGRLDLVNVNGSTGELLIGEGNGQFRLKLPAFSVGPSAFTAVAADMNGDGKLDLVTSNPSVILGGNGGNFQAPYISPYGGCNSDVVAVADFNRDGRPDVLSACNGNLQFYPGNGDGTLSPPLVVATDYNGINDAVVGDFNHDGIPDIAFTSTFFGPSSTATQVVIEIGNGDGTFQFKGSYLTPDLYGYSSSSLVAGNFNDDNNLDLAVLDYGDAIVSVLAANGDGTFNLPVLYGTGSNPVCIAAAPLQSPKRPFFEDLVFCSLQGVSIDLNTTK